MPSEIRFRSIATHVIVRVVILSIIGMTVFVSLLASWEYRTGKRSFRQDMAQHASSSLLLLSTALWDIDPAMVRKQVQWLSQMPQVGYVRVHSSTTGENFVPGSEPPLREATLVLDIPAPREVQTAGNIPLGRLEVWESRSYYFEQMYQTIAGMVLSYMLFTLLVCGLVSLVMRRQLRDPLRQITNFARALKPDDLTQTLVLRRPQREHVDEIDLVARGFVQLQQSLQSHIAHLDLLVAERTAQLEQMVEEVKRLSLTDALTGCLNRRALDERLLTEVERSRRYERSLSVIFVDMDHFKRINDQYGHATGDVVLREVALRCQRELRTQVDWLARYGGEEFLVVLPESDARQASELAHRLGAVMRDRPIDVDGLLLHVTASFGVAQLHEGDESMEKMLSRADAALYAAKAAGRDCVRMSEVQAPDEEKAPQP